MKISYNWLNDYLPEKIEVNQLSKILTSIGLEVESLERYEEVKGSLKDLVIGEILECVKHPEADKLMLTKVDIGEPGLLNIVCGAPNAAQGQKVIIARIGSTIYPFNKEPVLIKKTKIRGAESEGMICAEDEIGISADHSGILVLPDEAIKGMAVADYLKPYTDWIFEIGLLPSRMDAMSHLGVAKDVGAYLSHHEKETKIKFSFKDNFKSDDTSLPIQVAVENTEACQRYSGVSISGIKIQGSPAWLQQKLKSIGLRPINNIVDITNFILHETGQPLHAFDADEIKQNKIIVTNLPEKTTFITLDEKERILSKDDLMICDGDKDPMCFAGVFGGLKSGVKESTTNIFLESAWFHPASVRKTAVKHGLRTDAAAHFEKGTDISNTVNVLKRTAVIIKEIAGGKISSDIIDVYPFPKQKNKVTLAYDYLKKLSGKLYSRDVVKNILKNLDYEILEENPDTLKIAAPYNKPDITLPADVVEDIMRIDGYDNVDIPSAITISPVVETLAFEAALKEKVAGYLIGTGFSEIFTNSITNSNYYEKEFLKNSVRIINSLSVELDILRPRLLETGLECIAYNLNRKNNNLLLFEFGKSYFAEPANYKEAEHLSLFACGNIAETGWRHKGNETDIYFVKGILEKIFQLSGIENIYFKKAEDSLIALIDNEAVAMIKSVSKNDLDKFSIKKDVFYADIFWDKFVQQAKKIKIEYTEIIKFPIVSRDLSIVVNKNTTYESVKNSITKANIDRLTKVKLFDIFKNEKLGENKMSYAISFSFSDSNKTLTDKEVDNMINKLIVSFEKDLNAEIRK